LRDSDKFKGVFALLFTPFSADGKNFDRQSMQRQIDYVLEAGASGVVTCGKAGEFEGMTLKEVEQVLTAVVELVDHRVPVGMGMIGVEYEQGLQAARLAVRCGADFAMVKKLDLKEVRPFFLDVANHIPMMLYDETNEGALDVRNQVLPLVKECERIIAVKVSANIGYFAWMKQEAPDVALLCGWDIYTLLSYQTGSDGVIAGSAAIMPEREVALHRLTQQKKWEEARQLFYEQMVPFITFATPDPYAFSVCKYLLHWKGIFTSPVIRPPYATAPEWMQQEMRVLARWLSLIENQA
jgi:4-hydroxy-tetrahydrodipicolinate synthase